MKNTIFIVIGLVFVLSLLIWIFKPDTSLQPSQSVNHAIHQTDQNSRLNAHVSKADQQLQASSLAEIVAENSTQEGFDTQSDMSIQPIDPETDSGNQIVEPIKN